MTTGMSTLPFDGLTVVVTGTVPGLDRAQATAAVVALGGKPMGSVSGKTGLVVMGEGAGLSKTAKVRQHSIPVLSAQAFAALAADPSSWDGQPVGVPLDSLPAPVADADPSEVKVTVPWSRRAHMVGVATAPSEDGGTEYRCWCRCGLRWLGGPGAMKAGCPGDPESNAHRTTAAAPDAASSAALGERWGLRDWVDHAALVHAPAGEGLPASAGDEQEPLLPL